MIAGGNATLLVADLDRSVRFYVETLGFKLRARHGLPRDWAEVDAGGGLVLALHPAREGGGPRPGARGSITIGLEVNQPIAEVVQVLSNRGVVFLGPVRTDANGAAKHAFFVDPDGNALYLAEPHEPKT